MVTHPDREPNVKHIHGYCSFSLNSIDVTVPWIIHPPTHFVNKLTLIQLQSKPFWFFSISHISLVIWSDKNYRFLYCNSTVFIFHFLNFQNFEPFMGNKKLVWKMTHWTKYWVIIHNILVVSIKKSDEYK